MARSLTLVLNVGSSSLKAALFSPPEPQQPSTTALERLWQGETKLAAQELHQALNAWLEPQLQRWWPQIAVVGHRLVQGGEAIQAPTRVDAALLEQLDDLAPLAPLHNPPAIAAIGWLAHRQPQLPQWLCCDTAFHASLPPEAFSYALPEALRQQGYRRYGFHGLNHQHVAETAAAHWQRTGQAGLPRLISAHLGAGCSLAAIANGRSVDTSMGFTPLEGLVMATRSGSVDPGLLLHLQRQGMTLDQLEHTLQQASGLLGLSGLSGDWLTLQQAAAEGHAGAQLARAVFLHRLRAGIAAMAASLGGVDQIALSGGIGARDGALLTELQTSLGWLQPRQWLQVPADEEGMIAQLVAREAKACP